jgi:hypothetical protein
MTDPTAPLPDEELPRTEAGRALLVHFAPFLRGNLMQVADITAIEDEAADAALRAERAAPLDVERLTAAVGAAHSSTWDGWDSPREIAEVIAAEYARLADQDRSGA